MPADAATRVDVFMVMCRRRRKKEEDTEDREKKERKTGNEGDNNCLLMKREGSVVW